MLKWGFLINFCPAPAFSFVRLSIYVFSLFTSTPEPLGWFQPNLTQNNIRWKRYLFFVFFYMMGHAFFKGMQFVFIDTLLLLFKESSSQKPLNQKSCILCRNILRWCRFTFVHIMILVGSVGPRWVQGFNFLHRNMLRNFVLQYSSQQASGQKCCDLYGVV